MRELKNFVEHGICFSEDERLTKKLLEPRFALVEDRECPGARAAPRRKSSFGVAFMEDLLRRHGRSKEGKKRGPPDGHLPGHTVPPSQAD